MTRRHVALVQGAYYLLTGLWPLASIRTFERFTGPKTDDWLVRTVGLLASAIGAVLLLRSRSSHTGPDPVLGVATAAAFALTDVVHTARGVIPPVYLGDAAVELALVAAWGAAGKDVRDNAQRA